MRGPLPKKATSRAAKTGATKKHVAQPNELERRRKSAQSVVARAARAFEGDNFRTGGRGRHTTYNPDYAKQAAALCKFGATDWELANYFEVNLSTIKNWESQHKSFFLALRRGKAEADERVERSLYAKATGYTFESEKVFYDSKVGAPVRVATTEHVPPSDSAITMWLKNRKPGVWRDKVEVDANVNVVRTKPESGMTPEELSEYYNKLRCRPMTAEPLLIEHDKRTNSEQVEDGVFTEAEGTE